MSGSLGNTVRKREFEVLRKELLDVWALDIVGLLELNDLEDLHVYVSPRTYRNKKQVLVREWT